MVLGGEGMTSGRILDDYAERGGEIQRLRDQSASRQRKYLAELTEHRKNVKELQAKNEQLREALKDVIEFSNNETKSKRAKWAINKARQALNVETEK